MNKAVAERAIAQQGQQTFKTHAHWRLWFNRLGKIRGVAIVHIACDYGLELQENGLDELDRIEYCKWLRDTLNKAEGRIPR